MKQELFEGMPINKFCLKLVEDLCEGRISHGEFGIRLSRGLAGAPDLLAELGKMPSRKLMREAKDMAAVACEEVEVR